MMTRAPVLHHLQPEIDRLLTVCLQERENRIVAVLGKQLRHTLCLWLLPSGELASAATSTRDGPERRPLRVLNHTPQAHEKLQRGLGLGYSLHELIGRAAPVGIMFRTNLQAWVLGGNYANLGSGLSTLDLLALRNERAQGRPWFLIDPVLIQQQVKDICRQKLMTPRI